MSLKKEMRDFTRVFLNPELETSDADAGLSTKGNKNVLKLYQKLFFDEILSITKAFFPRLENHLKDEVLLPYIRKYFQKNKSTDILLAESYLKFPKFLKTQNCLPDSQWVLEKTDFEYQWQLCVSRGLELSVLSNEILEKFWRPRTGVKLRLIDQSFILDSFWDILKIDDNEKFSTTLSKKRKSYLIMQLKAARKIELIADKKRFVLLKLLKNGRTWHSIQKTLKAEKISQRYFFKFLNEGLNEAWLVLDE